MSDPVATDLASTLLAHREAFKAFLVARLGNEADAEDLLQNGLVKALDRAAELQDDEKAVPWFYQLLRHAIVDHVRSRSAATRRETAWATAALQDEAEAHRQICGCFEQLLPSLKPNYAELIRRVDLRNESVAAAAHALGLTPNNASVTLHRARAALRSRLSAFCRDCSCLEVCECAPAHPPANDHE